MEWDNLNHKQRREKIIEKQKSWKEYIKSLDRKKIEKHKTKFGRIATIVKYNETPISDGYPSKYVPFHLFDHFQIEFQINKKIIIDQITIPELTPRTNIWIVGIHEQNQPKYEWKQIEDIIEIIEKKSNPKLIENFRKWLCNMTIYHIERQAFMMHLETYYKISYNYFIPKQSIFVNHQNTYYLCHKIKPFIILQNEDWENTKKPIIYGEIIKFTKTQIHYTKQKQWLSMKNLRLLTNYDSNQNKYPSLYLIIQQYEKAHNESLKQQKQAENKVTQIITDIFKAIGNRVVSKYLQKPQIKKGTITYHSPGLMFIKIWEHLNYEKLQFEKYTKKQGKIIIKDKIQTANKIEGVTDYYMNKFMQFITHNALMTYSQTKQIIIFPKTWKFTLYQKSCNLVISFHISHCSKTVYEMQRGKLNL